MTARDDYPIRDFANDPMLVTTYYAMCDEIDRLRAWVRDLQITAEPKDELIRELTAHADAIRDRLAETTEALGPYSDAAIDHLRQVIAAYDDFIREA